MKIGFIGGGNMAGAIVNGVLSSGLCEKQEIAVCDKSKEALLKYDGVHTSEENLDALSCEVVVLAVKPNILPSVLEEIKTHKTDAVFVSIAAGVKLSAMKEILGNDAKIVRVMPNTPALVGEGMTVLATPDDSVTEEDFKKVQTIFDSVGKTEVLKEEMINTVTGISGSSPAYVYMMIEAMADAGVRDGLSRDSAYKLASQAVLGSAKMVLETGINPAALKDMVCSPNGTTIEAVAELEKRGFRASIMEAIKKCNDKANKMG